MVYDAFLLYNELDLLEIRLSILDPYVDKFVIVEATETFVGKPKPLYFEENKERFTKWKDKIIHYVVREIPPEIQAEALASPNTGNKEHFWLREYAHKEFILKALEGCKDDDIIFISDLDELWNPETVMIEVINDQVYRPIQTAYHYFLNNRSDQDIGGWVGTRFGNYKTLKKHGVNHFRSEWCCPSVRIENGGYHFSNMGGLEALKQKLTAYSHVEWSTPQILARLEPAMKHGVDFAGRGFNLWVSEEELPQYLKDNKTKYAHLFKK